MSNKLKEAVDWAMAESAKLEANWPKGSKVEKDLLAQWQNLRPKMMARLAVFPGSVTALAHVLVDRKLKAQEAYVTSGMPIPDADLQAAQEWLMLEPETQDSQTLFAPTITSQIQNAS